MQHPLMACQLEGLTALGKGAGRSRDVAGGEMEDFRYF
ncbi:hypothetical protein thalar_01148 [Litoreibacter arenae DSM 19593]|uniref:Uncharacterized protein n=1 Tax=Litoreibacter arenae DSM 19593 TaxID=1123360 RepID=S9QHI7_9RHOB|nr:hypothetical protein thalar_01148 [Litoreibacter arenae DSM 19593]